MGVYTNRKMTQFLGSDIVQDQTQAKGYAHHRNILNKKLFKVLDVFSTIGPNSIASGNHEANELISLNAIIIHHQALKSTQRKNCSQFFAVEKSPNNYSNDSGRESIFKIKILDVLFDNKVCNLVYMKDITKLFKSR